MNLNDAMRHVHGDTVIQRFSTVLQSQKYDANSLRLARAHYWHFGAIRVCHASKAIVQTPILSAEILYGV